MLLNIINIKKRHKRKFFISILIGVLVIAFYHFNEDTDWAINQINKELDVAVKDESVAVSNKLVTLAGNSKLSTKVAFIEIDDSINKAWGSQMLTPRNKLADIIKYTANAGAKIIVPDFIFDYSDVKSPQSDLRLAKVLQELTDKKSAVKIIFPVGIKSDGALSSNIFQNIINRNPNFYSAVSGTLGSGADNKIRFWRPFEITTTNDKKLLWSVPFLAAILSEEHGDDILDLLQNIVSKPNFNSHTIGLKSGDKIKLVSNTDDIYLYRMRFLLVPHDTIALSPQGNMFDNLFKPEEIGHANFKDKIVIIGNSSHEAMDIHQTPVGPMAGMFIIGNTIHTILSGLQPHKINLFVTITIELLLILFLSLLSNKATYMFAISCLLLSQFRYLVVTPGFADYNLCINFVAPITFIFYAEAVVNFIEYIIAKFKKFIKSKHVVMDKIHS